MESILVHVYTLQHLIQVAYLWMSAQMSLLLLSAAVAVTAPSAQLLIYCCCFSFLDPSKFYPFLPSNSPRAPTG